MDNSIADGCVLILDTLPGQAASIGGCFPGHFFERGTAGFDILQLVYEGEKLCKAEDHQVSGGIFSECALSETESPVMVCNNGSSYCC